MQTLMKILSNLFGNNTKINASAIAIKKADNTADTLDNCVIVDSGSNSNGSWIKWADGTMICSNTVQYTNVAITTVWGSFYESSKLSLGGNYPVPFIEEPDLIVTSHYPNLVEKYGDANAITPGTFYATKPKSTTGETVKVSYIAVGKWK